MTRTIQRTSISLSPSPLPVNISLHLPSLALSLAPMPGSHWSCANCPNKVCFSFLVEDSIQEHVLHLVDMCLQAPLISNSSKNLFASFMSLAVLETTACTFLFTWH